MQAQRRLLQANKVVEFNRANVAPKRNAQEGAQSG